MVYDIKYINNDIGLFSAYTTTGSSAALVGRFLDSQGNYITSLVALTATGAVETSLLNMYKVIASGATSLPGELFECQVASGTLVLDIRARKDGTIRVNDASFAETLRRGTKLTLGGRNPYGYSGAPRLQNIALFTAAATSLLSVEFLDANSNTVPISNGTVSVGTLNLTLTGAARSLAALVVAHGFETSANVPGIPKSAQSAILNVKSNSPAAVYVNTAGSDGGLGGNGFYDTATAPTSSTATTIAIGGILTVGAGSSFGSSSSSSSTTTSVSATVNLASEYPYNLAVVSETGGACTVNVEFLDTSWTTLSTGGSAVQTFAITGTSAFALGALINIPATARYAYCRVATGVIRVNNGALANNTVSATPTASSPRRYIAGDEFWVGLYV